MQDQPPIVRLAGVSKRFGGVHALSDVSFDLQHGETHALVGENGAGKSTLMKILQGVYTPDEGTLEVGGERVSFRSAEDARAHGVGMIFQEFSLIPTLTVAQNVFLGREPRRQRYLLDDDAARRGTHEVLQTLGLDLDPDAPVSSLGTAQWQLVEIAKALSQDARILIMDEPTASLTRTETEALFGRMRLLKERGLSLVYISHRMEEILAVADRVTVLRDGRRVFTRPAAELTMGEIIDGMVGRSIDHAFTFQPKELLRDGAPRLKLRGVTTKRLRGVDLEVHPGEIVGLVGLMGSGRTAVADALFGLDRITSGTLEIDGVERTLRRTQDAIDAGVGLIPEDRRRQGLVLEHAIAENVLLPNLRSVSRRGLVRSRSARQVVDRVIEEMDVRTDDTGKEIRLLSGGNQQKVVIGKWLGTEPSVLVMDEPTAGVDVGAKSQILEAIRSLADQGKAVVLISSEIPELLAISDRVVVMRAGRIVTQIDRQHIEDEIDLHRLIQNETPQTTAEADGGRT